MHKFATIIVDAAGIRNIHGYDGVMLDPDMSLCQVIDEAFWVDEDGFAHVQIIGDSARAKKIFGVTNICFRGFHSRPFFNGLSTMHQL